MQITKKQIKNSGATFTPKMLADFLANKIISYTGGGRQKVLDPACGEGELLLAMAQKLSGSGMNFDITGYDSHAGYLHQAKERMLLGGFRIPTLIKDNFLRVVDLTDKQMAMDFVPILRSAVNNSFDIVIANPPYVRTQLLGSEQAQVFAKKFNLKGRVDLYYPFLIAMTESLKEGGILGVITSNRYLSTKSGESIRKYLSANYDILEVIDLGDTKLFDAAILPAIFIGRKSKSKKTSSTTFIKIYEELNGYAGNLTPVDTIYDALSINGAGYFTTGTKRYKKTVGTLALSSWEMLSGVESSWVSAIDAASKNKVRDFFKVRVGIKTTADSVFIGDNWDTLKEKPEKVLLKDLLSQENIERWSITEKVKLQVLYPHYADNGIKHTIDISKYPKAKKYFQGHEEKLRSRKYLIDAGRKWFEIWVPHNPAHWALPKLVFPDISLSPRFYFDKAGKIVNGNCYWIAAENKKDIDKLLLVQGIANSKIMTKYHDLVFNNKLYSGRRRYFTQYVERYPLPDHTSSASKEIIEIVKKLNKTTDTKMVTRLEHSLEIKVAEAFGVAPVFNLD
jgi:adenine-specific DNA-methyltransferase